MKFNRDLIFPAIFTAALGSPIDTPDNISHPEASTYQTMESTAGNTNATIDPREVDDLGCTFRPFSEPNCGGEQLGTFRYYFVHGCQPCQTVVGKFLSFSTSDLYWNGSFNHMFYEKQCGGLGYEDIFYNETLGCFSYRPELSDGWYSFEPCIGGW